jgi:ABC-2 type transport system permease protein
MPALDRTATVVRHNLTLVGREPGPMISRIVMPVVIVLVLRPLYTSALGGRAPGTAQAVVGMLVMFSLLGMSVVGNAVLTERSWHTLDRLRATPARPVELLAGKAVPVLALVLAQQAVVLGLGIGVLHLHVASYTLLGLAVASWAATLLCLGSALAMLVRSHAELSAATDIGSMIFTCLGGALVPLSAMPAWARTIAPVSPGYWAMRCLLAALDGDAHTALTSAGVLLGVAAVAATVAGVRLARGWGRSRLL